MYENISQMLLGISSVSFLVLLYLIGNRLRKKLKINILSIYYVALILTIFSFFPLYLTNSVITYFIAQFFAFLFILFYLKVILSVLKSDLSVFKLLIFSILTFGIYSYFFFFRLIKEVKEKV
ncbi:DUF4234 domain-containing protein [Thermosipho melanesiensis]|uniref:DUF4234 domain-containing protein n=1 Tax=Thermosipho melanesiensis TaxID=46541 RepID=UPI00214AA367|nr:DUF4234 domain-containing protein [Thermosipho melanesiensis]